MQKNKNRKMEEKMNYEYDEAVLKCFLKQQKKLFSEPVASSMEEAV